MDELQAAALTYGALSHRRYKDDRKAMYVKEAEARWRKAAKKYHEIVMLAAFVKD